MDLHTTGALPSDEEKSAVDTHLRGPRQREHSEPPFAMLDGRPLQFSSRTLLLPTLHAVQGCVGWISPGALNYISQQLGIAPAEVYGVASFYDMFALAERPRVVAHVCEDIACMTRGATELCGQLEKSIGPAGSPCVGGGATWVRSPCLGLCERAPAVLVSAAGRPQRERVLAPADSQGTAALVSDAVNGKLPEVPDTLNLASSVPQATGLGLRLLRRVGRVDPSSVEGYRRLGGYDALQRAADMGPERIIRELLESRLLGRGGAAFPTGKKWEAVHLQRHLGRIHYVVCNADESEPGTFKDRLVMEGDPFAVLEGMTIAALAIGAEQGYIYVRGEYPLATQRLEYAIRTARAERLLGSNILGRGFNFYVELRRGAGAYVCGEETALFNSIEGYRGEPRNKPPFPTQSGLFGQPTVVNNVETLVNVPNIILKGGAAYAREGTENSKGTRLFCLSGHVVRPGVYEVPFGHTLRNVIDLAGGVGGTGRLQAVLLGGAAGTFLSPSELDVPLTFEATRSIGATLGSGVVLCFDDSIDLRHILLRIAAFFRHETCGQCVPCRVGVVRQQEALARLVSLQPLGSVAGELSLVREMGQAMRDASICGLGQTASSALESALNRFGLFT